MRLVHHAPLKQVGEPHVRLDEVEAKRGRALELLSELRPAIQRRAAGIVDARSIERLARAEQPRPDPAPAFDRLLFLRRLERACRGVPDGRDSPRQPDPSE
jgi:hypothetical protein